MTYTGRTACRLCGHDLEPILSLGQLAISDYLPREGKAEYAPLDLMQCVECQLVQLGHTVNPERLYADRYWYRSGINETMKVELRDVVIAASRMIARPISCVVDIGANDGTLLSFYMPAIIRVAFEPSPTFDRDLVKVADVRCGFFPDPQRNLYPKTVDIATSIAMFYDLDDPLSFVAEIDRILAPDGVWVVQMQDLAQMVQQKAFDNICHEHLCYYTPGTFAQVLDPFDLALVKIETRSINGGSLRFYVRRKKYAVADCSTTWNVSRHALDAFAAQIDRTRDQLRTLIVEYLSRDWVIDLYAASTKSSTLLQYCDLTDTTIRSAVERSPEKVGLFTAGTNIRIVSEAEWRRDPGQVALLGAWQFKKAFVEREQAYLKDGGTFVVPLPNPEVVYASVPTLRE